MVLTLAVKVAGLSFSTGWVATSSELFHRLYRLPPAIIYEPQLDFYSRRPDHFADAGIVLCPLVFNFATYHCNIVNSVMVVDSAGIRLCQVWNG